MSPATPEVGSTRKSGAPTYPGLPAPARHGKRTDIHRGPFRQAFLPEASPPSFFCDTMRLGSGRCDRIVLSVKRQEVAAGGRVQDRHRSNLSAARYVSTILSASQIEILPAAVSFQYRNIGRRCRAASPSFKRACPRSVPETMALGAPRRARDAAHFRFSVQVLYPPCVRHI